MILSPVVIGLSGNSRSGKDTFYKIFSSLMKDKINTKKIALADELKKDCEPFLKEKCNLNVWAENTETKTIFRNFLVWYGGVKRSTSNGRYWIEKIYPEVKSLMDNNIIPVITDIRYAQYAKDEYFWIKNELNGILVFIKKFSVEPIEDRFIKTYNPPANEDERNNNIILEQNADFIIEWAESATQNPETDDQLIKQVQKFIDWLFLSNNSKVTQNTELDTRLIIQDTAHERGN